MKIFFPLMVLVALSVPPFMVGCGDDASSTPPKTDVPLPPDAAPQEDLGQSDRQSGPFCDDCWLYDFDCDLHGYTPEGLMDYTCDCIFSNSAVLTCNGVGDIQVDNCCLSLLPPDVDATVREDREPLPDAPPGEDAPADGPSDLTSEPDMAMDDGPQDLPAEDLTADDLADGPAAQVDGPGTDDMVGSLDILAAQDIPGPEDVLLQQDVPQPADRVGEDAGWCSEGWPVPGIQGRVVTGGCVGPSSEADVTLYHGLDLVGTIQSGLDGSFAFPDAVEDGPYHMVVQKSMWGATRDVDMVGGQSIFVILELTN